MGGKEMKLNNAGYGFTHPKGFMINRPHGSGDFIFLLIRSEAYAVLHGKRQRISPGSVIVLREGTPQLYGSDVSEFINDWIHFSPTTDEELGFSELGISTDTPYPIPEPHTLSQIIKGICYERYSENPRREETILLYIKLLFIKLSEQISLDKSKKATPYLAKLRELRSFIYTSPSEPMDVDRAAARLSLSRSYFQHLYKATFGVGFIADLRSARLEHAKYLLRADRGSTVASVAAACGYSSELHFMRLFKDQLGLTPTEYRNSK